MESSSKKSEVQDVLDSVLKIAYPYISELEKLSQMKVNLSSKDSIQLSLKPSLLPMSYEDRSELVVGLLTEGNKTSVVKVHVWRAKSQVWYKRNSKCFFKISNTETEDVVDMADATEACTITLTANGEATKAWHSPWGDYVATGAEHNEAAVFRNSDGKYLYKHDDGTWCAGTWIGGSGLVRSGTTAGAASPCPASVSSNWHYYEGEWKSGDIRVKCSVHTL